MRIGAEGGGLMLAGIDIGGTNIKFGLVDTHARVVERGVIETLASAGPAQAMERVHTALASIAGRRSVTAVGIGCAGLINPGTGVIQVSPNLPAWEGKSIARAARRYFSNVSVDNDANCAAWGEYHASGRKDDIVFITLGTGVGGGVVTGGRLVRGTANYGSEIGHATVMPDGERCRCGARGCLEAYAGAYGLVRSASKLLRERPSRYLMRWMASGHRLTPELIARAARKGDGVGKRVYKEAGKFLGVAIASLINIFNPELVVLGGGGAGAFDLLEPEIEKHVARNAFGPTAKFTTIKPSTLGNDAAVVGAAMFAHANAKSP